MAPEVPVIEPVDRKIVAAFGFRPVDDVVEVEQPAPPRRVGAVARVVLADQADAAGLEASQAEEGDEIVVHRGLADDLVVRRERLRADEPVVLHPQQVAQREGADVIFRLQGHAGPDEVVVVVLDQAADGDRDQPMPVGVERGPPEHDGGRRVRRRVLRADAEDRHLRLGVELADVARERAERRAELGIVGERRQQQPRRRRFLRIGRRGLRLWR